MYGVVALFDDTTENVIKNIWQELRERSISDYAYEIEDRRPHITISSYNNLNETDFIKKMDRFLESKSTMDITFQSIGSFLTSGALFFSPTVTKDLIEFHSDFHHSLKDFNDDPNSLYLPEKWVPHCTIANRLSKEKLLEAFEHCSYRQATIRGKITEIALIKLEFENGKSVRAPIIYSKELKVKSISMDKVES